MGYGLKALVVDTFGLGVEKSGYLSDAAASGVLSLSDPEIGFFFGLLFRIEFVKNFINKPFAWIGALNWLRSSATVKFFMAVTRLTESFQRRGDNMQ